MTPSRADPILYESWVKDARQYVAWWRRTEAGPFVRRFQLRESS